MPEQVEEVINPFLILSYVFFKDNQAGGDVADDNAEEQDVSINNKATNEMMEVLVKENQLFSLIQRSFIKSKIMSKYCSRTTKQTKYQTAVLRYKR